MLFANTISYPQKQKMEIRKEDLRCTNGHSSNASVIAEQQESTIHETNGRSVYQVGYWSAAITTALSVLFLISLVIGALNLMFLSSFLLAPAFVAMMVSINRAAPDIKKIWSQLGLAYAVIYAGMCSLAYYLQLTVISSNPLQLSPETLQPFVFIPGTPVFAQDMLGYVFMCAATLSTGFVFGKGRLEKWMKGLFLVNGLFILPVLLIPALPLPVNETGTGIGDMIGTYANMVWSAFFAAATGLVCAWFWRFQHKFTSR